MDVNTTCSQFLMTSNIEKNKELKKYKHNINCKGMLSNEKPIPILIPKLWPFSNIDVKNSKLQTLAKKTKVINTLVLGFDCWICSSYVKGICCCTSKAFISPPFKLRLLSEM